VSLICAAPGGLIADEDVHFLPDDILEHADHDVVVEVGEEPLDLRGAACGVALRNEPNEPGPGER
jgi:hypothetical protein